MYEALFYAEFDGIIQKIGRLYCLGLIFGFTCFRRAINNELRNLQLFVPRSSEPRETFVEDRTKAHADHIGQGFDRQTTAAAAILKAIHCSQK